MKFRLVISATVILFFIFILSSMSGKVLQKTSKIRNTVSPLVSFSSSIQVQKVSIGKDIHYTLILYPPIIFDVCHYPSYDAPSFISSIGYKSQVDFRVDPLILEVP